MPLRRTFAACMLSVSVILPAHSFEINGKQYDCSKRCDLPYEQLLQDKWARASLQAFFVNKTDAQKARQHLSDSFSINESDPFKKKKKEKAHLDKLLRNYQSLSGEVFILVKGTIGDAGYEFGRELIHMYNIVLDKEVTIEREYGRLGWSGSQFRFCELNKDDYILGNLLTACGQADVFSQRLNRIALSRVTSFPIPEAKAEEYFETKKKVEFRLKVTQARLDYAIGNFQTISGFYNKENIRFLRDDGSLLHEHTYQN